MAKVGTMVMVGLGRCSLRRFRLRLSLAGMFGLIVTGVRHQQV